MSSERPIACIREGALESRVSLAHSRVCGSDVPSPIACLLAAFSGGVLALQVCGALPRVVEVAFVAVACAAVVFACHALRHRSPRACALVTVVCTVLCAGLAGFGYGTLRAQVRLADVLPSQWEGVDLELIGVVDDLPQNTDQGTRFAFAVEHVETAGAIVPTRISLAWYAPRTRDADDDVPPPQVRAGERWRLVARLKRPHGNVNPAGFDLEAWLLENNLRATGYVRESDVNARIDGFVGRATDYVQRARERIRERILAALPDAPDAGVLIALAIGDQRAIPEAQWLVFNRTGIAHLVSISGLHVTAFAVLAGAIVGGLARRSFALTSRIPARKIAAGAGALFAFAYVLLAGAEVPAVRTLLMLWVGAFGLWLSRPGTASIVWLWSLAVVLAWDPWAGLTPGFWLSFGAVGLLLYAGSGRLTQPVRAGWRVRAQHVVAEGARTQWVVTVGLVPGTLALFQQVSIVSAIANAIAIPVVTLIVVPLALAGIVLPLDWIWTVAHTVLAWLMRFLEMLAAWPPATWASHAPAAWTVMLAIVGTLWLLAPRGVPGRTLGAAWIAPLLLVTPAPPPIGGVRMTVLDVGQGLAVVVETATHALVYDTGPRFNETTDAGGRIVAPFLRAAGIRRVDALVVSHQDLDHSGGALSLLQTTPVGVLVSSLPAEHPIVERASRRAMTFRCVEGQQWEWDGVGFRVLQPPPSRYQDPRAKTNDLSCVVRVESPHGAILLTGDIEARSERALLEADRDSLAAEVLVVPHHGSRTSSTLAFVDAVAPRIAIFTPGYRNRFGHPRADVVARYVAIDAMRPRTDYDGAVTVTIEPDREIVVERERERRRRYWFDAPQTETAAIE